MTLLSALALAACGLAACGKDVCKEGVGPLSEVTVAFKGFSLSQAVTLEIDSAVEGPAVEGSGSPYRSRRVGRMAFPDSARDGSATFVFDPGGYIMGLRLLSEAFTMTVWLRVYDDAGLLLGEGRYRVAGRTNQCWLNRKMTVSGTQTCSHKEAGDACASRSGQPYVCKPAGVESLACDPSSCGDGFLDSQNGEICDPGLDMELPCSSTCLPPLAETTLWEEGPDWHQVDTHSAPPPRYLAAGAVHAESGLFVLFGGQNEALEPMGDTWLFDGEHWIESSLGTPPDPRFGHAMAYDADRGVVLLFGGTQDATSNPEDLFLNDLHQFDPVNGWQPVPPLGDPPPAGRFGAAMAYHPGSGAVDPGFVLYGGKQAGESQHWEDPRATFRVMWDVDQGAYLWDMLELPTSNLPSAYPVLLLHHTMTWVPSRGEILMVGGQRTDQVTTSPDRNPWRFSPAPGETNGIVAWTAVEGSDSREDITRHQAVAGPGFADLLLVGGTTSTQETSSISRFLGMWSLVGSTWTHVVSTNVPPARTGHVAFYLPESDTLYTFGGHMRQDPSRDAPVISGNDTWFYSDQSNPEAAVVLAANLKVDVSYSSDVRGFYSLGQGDIANGPLDRVASLALADLDGDGQDEVALGLPGGPDSSSNKVGAVYLHDPYNNERRVSESGTGVLLTVMAPQRDTESPWGPWLGGGLAAGDLNADGAADLVIGAPLRISTATPEEAEDPERLESGAVYVVLGGNARNIPVSGGVQRIITGSTTDSARHRTIHGEPVSPDLNPGGDRFGYALAVGDFDGDGFADLAIGAPLRSDSLGAPGAGAVYILSGAGAEAWPSGGDPRAVTAIAPAPVVLRSNTEGLNLGVSLAVGDVDGDGITDLVVGSGTTADRADCQPPACGALAILYGHSGFFGAGGRELLLESLGSSDSSLATAPGGQDDPLFGLGGVVTVVDLDLDARGEVVAALGRPDQRSGGPRGVALLRGRGLRDTLSQSSDALATTHLVLQAPADVEGSGFGAALGAGDVNGDRRFDLLIGAPFEPMRRNDLPAAAPAPILRNVGALYVVMGSRLARYWDPLGTGDSMLSVDDIQGWTGDDQVAFPLVKVQGGLADGFFGAAVATSSQIAHVRGESPYPFTLVFQPGWFSKGAQTTITFSPLRGRLHTLALNALLGGPLPEELAPPTAP